MEAIWGSFLMQEGMEASPACLELAATLAQIYRGVSRKRLQLYPDVKKVLEDLRLDYRLALVSDAQPCYALPEMKAMGLDGYFNPVIISAYYGFRKPDARLTERAMEDMNLQASEVIYVGNDMYRDIYGANRLGIKTIFLDSNQGVKTYENVNPSYYAGRFEDVLKGVMALI